jgi:hypothetical protein
MPHWKTMLAGVAAFIVVAVAGIAVVRWLTPPTEPIISASVPSLETEWNNTIARLGIDPVYPPEEDLAVGDLLAIVVGDEEDVVETKKTDPILRRSVKLAHIDLRDQLEKAYAMLTVFMPTPASAPQSGAAAAPAALASHRMFTADMPKNQLPQAAFPSLIIQANNNANFDASGAGWGLAKFGASNRGFEELRLTDVRTYGLPSIRAMEALTNYCAAEKTKDDCLETTARGHLERVVGPLINKVNVDENGANRFRVSIEIAIVNRVYLTNQILHVRRFGVAQGGGARVSRPSADAGKVIVPAPAPAAGNLADIDAVKKRLDEMEAQLPKTTTGSALAFESESGSEIVLKETFDGPIAIGIRTVRYRFPDTNQPQTASTP